VVVTLLLALVGANLAALFHARWLAAHRELAVRAALGGSRGALARTLASEGAWIGGAGLALGLVLARVAQPLLARQLPRQFTDVGAEVLTTPTTLALAGIVAGLWFGLAALLPAWRVARLDPFRLLRGDAGAAGGRDVRRRTRVLVALQVGLAVALGAATLGVALDFRARSALDLGYNPEGVAIFSVSLTSGPYIEAAARTRFAEQAVAAVAALPAVTHAASVHMHPSGRSSFGALLELPDNTAAEDRLLAQDRLVSVDFLDMLGLRLLEGRWLSRADGINSPPVAVISESVARRFFPNGGAVGRQLRNQRATGVVLVEVVGVVGDVHEFQPSNAAWYRSLAQFVGGRETTLQQIALRVAPQAQLPSFATLRAAIGGIDPGVALFDYTPAEELLGETVVAQRDAAAGSAFLALVGLALAALGLFVRVAEAVVRRRRELGVRLALGATHRRLVAGLVREGVILAGAGLVPGALLSLALQRLLSHRLDAPALANDVRPLLLALAVTASTVLATAWLAGRRASLVDPAQALKAD
jgi:putative ABC transport system permease protein